MTKICVLCGMRYDPNHPLSDRVHAHEEVKKRSMEPEIRQRADYVELLKSERRKNLAAGRFDSKHQKDDPKYTDYSLWDKRKASEEHPGIEDLDWEPVDPFLYAYDDGDQDP